MQTRAKTTFGWGGKPPATLIHVAWGGSSYNQMLSVAQGGSTRATAYKWLGKLAPEPSADYWVRELAPKPLLFRGSRSQHPSHCLAPPHLVHVAWEMGNQASHQVAQCEILQAIVEVSLGGGGPSHTFCVAYMEIPRTPR